MDGSDRKIKVFWAETFGGERFDVEAPFHECNSGGVYPDVLINNYRSEQVEDIKGFYIHNEPVKKGEVTNMAFISSYNYMENIYLPEGLRVFSCRLASNIRIKEFDIPWSLERLTCFNDMKIIGLEEKMEYGNLWDIELLDRDL